LPFTSEGKIIVSGSTWNDSFQVKWSFLEKICHEFHWQQVLRNLEKPSEISFQKAAKSNMIEN